MRLFSIERGTDPPRTTECDQQYVEDEYELESLVHAVPEVLLDEPVLIIGRQVNLDTGVLDLLALDRWANTLVFELKRGRSDVGSASEATILSQPIAYGRSLSGYDYDDLNDVYQDYCAEWDASGGSLTEVFESTFGNELDTEAYNREQRIAIVAEDITPRTRRNARYLVQQGILFQCIEVGLFDKDGEVMLSSSTVVDYDEARIRPPRHDAPRFFALNRRIIEKAFPQIQDVVAAQVPHDHVSDLDKRAPWLRSQHGDHPEAVVYRWKIAPQQTQRQVTPGNVAVRLDIETGVDDDDSLTLLRENAERFEAEGFTFESGRSTFGIVHDHWEANPEQLDSDEFLDEVAGRYAELVELGHDVLVGADR
jgi:hypothetical protein